MKASSRSRIEMFGRLHAACYDAMMGFSFLLAGASGEMICAMPQVLSWISSAKDGSEEDKNAVMEAYSLLLMGKLMFCNAGGIKLSNDGDADVKAWAMDSCRRGLYCEASMWSSIHRLFALPTFRRCSDDGIDVDRIKGLFLASRAWGVYMQGESGTCSLQWLQDFLTRNSGCPDLIGGFLCACQLLDRMIPGVPVMRDGTGMFSEIIGCRRLSAKAADMRDGLIDGCGNPNARGMFEFPSLHVKGPSLADFACFDICGFRNLAFDKSGLRLDPWGMQDGEYILSTFYKEETSRPPEDDDGMPFKALCVEPGDPRDQSRHFYRRIGGMQYS